MSVLLKENDQSRGCALFDKTMTQWHSFLVICQHQKKSWDGVDNKAGNNIPNIQGEGREANDEDSC